MSVRSGFQCKYNQSSKSCFVQQNRELTPGAPFLQLRSAIRKACHSGPWSRLGERNSQLFFATAHEFTFRPGSCDVSCCHVDLAFDLAPPLALVVRFWRIQPLLGLTLAALRTWTSQTRITGKRTDTHQLGITNPLGSSFLFESFQGLPPFLRLFSDKFLQLLRISFGLGFEAIHTCALAS